MYLIVMMESSIEVYMRTVSASRKKVKLPKLLCKTL